MAAVLIVDDEPDIRMLTRLSLETEAHEVVEASTGEHALELAGSSAFDLVLLDIRLPGIDGWDVLKSLRTDHGPDELPIVIMSAHSSESTLIRAREEGCNDYIVKPFKVDDLLRIVREQTSARPS
ncbi:MAG: response regulator [Actinomycetota bacterium]|nr:response regulator [Actinomycetota bacterium]